MQNQFSATANETLNRNEEREPLSQINNSKLIVQQYESTLNDPV